MKIVYFSGFGSRTDPNSPKIQMLEEFSDRVVIVSAIPNTVQEYTTEFHKVFDYTDLTEPVLMVGTSLGGFWARYFGRLTGNPWIALNPVVDPVIQLRDLVGAHTAYGTDEEFEFTDRALSAYSAFVAPNTVVPGLVITAEDDDALEYHRLDGWVQCAKHSIPKGGHRLNNVEDYKYLISEFIKGPATHGHI